MHSKAYPANHLFLRIAFLALAVFLQIPVFPLGYAYFIFPNMGYSNGEIVDTAKTENVTLVFSKADGSLPPTYYDTGTAIRLYTGNTLTISSYYYIERIEFTYDESSGDDYVPDEFHLEISSGTYDFSDHKWTGDATEVTFSRQHESSGHFRYQQIWVYFDRTRDTRLDAGLAYTPSSITVEQGATFTSPTFTKTTTADVTFTSDNEAVATVDAEGAIELAGDTGTAVITAICKGNTEYSPDTATCTVTVYLPDDASSDSSAADSLTANDDTLTVEPSDSLTTDDDALDTEPTDSLTSGTDSLDTDDDALDTEPSDSLTSDTDSLVTDDDTLDIEPTDSLTSGTDSLTTDDDALDTEPSDSLTSDTDSLVTDDDTLDTEPTDSLTSDTDSLVTDDDALDIEPTDTLTSSTDSLTTDDDALDGEPSDSLTSDTDSLDTDDDALDDEPTDTLTSGTDSLDTDDDALDDEPTDSLTSGTDSLTTDDDTLDIEPSDSLASGGGGIIAAVDTAEYYFTGDINDWDASASRFSDTDADSVYIIVIDSLYGAFNITTDGTWDVCYGSTSGMLFTDSVEYTLVRTSSRNYVTIDSVYSNRLLTLTVNADSTLTLFMTEYTDTTSVDQNTGTGDDETADENAGDDGSGSGNTGGSEDENGGDDGSENDEGSGNTDSSEDENGGDDGSDNDDGTGDADGSEDENGGDDDIDTSVNGIDVNAGNDADAPVYNLRGQRVSRSTKGIIIINGRKYYNR